MEGPEQSIPLSVLTWNINFRSAATLDPIAALPSLPDLVALQEVKLDHAKAVHDRLKGMGYTSVYSQGPDAARLSYGNMIAARTKLTSFEPIAVDFPYPQLVAHVSVETSGGPVNVITVHVPNGSGYGWEKIDTLEALKRMVLGLRGEPLVLTGDFNEPQYAMQDGQVVTWGQDPDGERWAVSDEWTFDGATGTGERWDAAVRWFFESPGESGIRSAFWDAAGHGEMEASHFSRGGKRWFDHVFVSGDFQVNDCRYLHDFREDEYSDHSALIAELSYAPGQ